MKDKDHDEEEYTGKVIVFNPAGFILKIIFSVGLTVLLGAYNKEGGVSLNAVFSYAIIFVMFWFIASMFGFCLRATGNYIIAAILLVGLTFLLSMGMTWLSSKGEVAGTIGGIAFIVLLVWLPINDVRKAIIYFKNTI